MKLFLVLFVISGFRLATSINSKCKLPQPQYTDWSKAAGLWYEIMNEQTAQDKARFCSTETYIKTDYGYELLLEYRNKNGDEESIRSHGQRTADGYFTDVVALGKKETDFLDVSLGGHYATADHGEADFGKMAHYTDYENYLIGFQCDHAGRALLWILTRNPDPAADVYEEIYDKLDEIGGGWEKINLSPAICTE